MLFPLKAVPLAVCNCQVGGKEVGKYRSMHAIASCILYFVLGFRIKYAISVFGGFDENFEVEELSFPVHDLSKFCTDCGVVSD